MTERLRFVTMDRAAVERRAEEDDARAASLLGGLRTACSPGRGAVREPAVALEGFGGEARDVTPGRRGGAVTGAAA